MSTDNVLTVYRRATDADHAAGMSWYNEAHSLALELSPDDVYRAAGVISALSPRLKWNINVRIARRAFETGTVTGHTKVMCSMAQRILDGEYVFDVLKGDKTRAFADAIATNGKSSIATVDRHALEIALGKVYSDKERPNIGKRLYREMASYYSEAADIAGITVNEMQAVTWVTWRREKGVK